MAMTKTQCQWRKVETGEVGGWNPDSITLPAGYVLHATRTVIYGDPVLALRPEQEKVKAHLSKIELAAANIFSHTWRTRSTPTSMLREILQEAIDAMAEAFGVEVR